MIVPEDERRKHRPTDDFHGRWLEGGEPEGTIVRVLEAVGYSVSVPAAGRTGGVVQCRHAIRSTFERHGLAGFLEVLALMVRRDTTEEGFTEAAWKDAERSVAAD
jgi:hypothetical protein